MFENGVTYQFIGNITNGATSGTTAGKDIAAGSAALVKVADNKVYETDQTAVSGLFRLVQKTAGGQLIYSPEFEMSKITIHEKSYSAPAEQVSYWGYNGTSGSLGTIVSGDTYVLHITLTSYAPGLSTSPLVKTVPFVAQSAVESDLAMGLAQSFVRVFGREPYKVIQCDVVSSAAVTAANCLDNDATVVNGSKAFTVATSLAYNTGAGTLAVGDYIRLQGPSASGTALTDPVYEVVDIDTLTVTVDRPITTASGTYAALDDELEVIPAATGDAADFGFKFTGLDRFADSGFNPQNDFYSKTRFSVASSDFDAGTVETVSTVADEGVGTAYEVAQFESKYAMNEYVGRYQSAYPATVYRGEADLATPKTYDTIVIEGVKNEYTSPTTGHTPVSKFSLILRTEVSLAGDDIDTALGVTV